MFCKLALRNVRRSFRDYGVYLLTLTLGVCLFYTFNSVEGQGAMVVLAQSQNPMVEAILTLIDVFSGFVAVVLACLILYADQFLLRRRKRELGVYLVLGLGQEKVSRLLFLETGLIGLISLLLGLGLGVLASWGLSALTLSMFELDVSALLGLRFSWRAAGKTALYFGLILLLVMLFRGVQVSRAKLVDLLQGQRKNEELKTAPLNRAVAQLVTGVLCLAAAYGILLYFGMAIAVVTPALCVPMLALGTLGTLLIFKSLSGFVLKLAQSRPSFYYQNLNLFTLRQWISRVHTTYLSQTVICILLLLAIGVTASAVGMNTSLESMTDWKAPFDLTIQNQSADWVGQVDFDRALEDAGFDRSRIAWSHELLVYYNDPAVTGAAEANGALSAADYDVLMARQGKRGYSGPLPHALGWAESNSLTTGGLNLDLVLVPEEMTRELKPRREVWSADYAGSREETEEALLQTLSHLQQEFSIHVYSRLEIYRNVMGNKIVTLYLGLYLGLTFLLAAAAVLALQQLSQAADNAGRYALLRRLGAEERQTARSAAQQVALAFFLPLGLALVHSAVGMKAANDLIAAAGRVDSAASSAVTALVLLAVYGGYFLATALASRSMAKRA